MKGIDSADPPLVLAASFRPNINRSKDGGPKMKLDRCSRLGILPLVTLLGCLISGREAFAQQLRVGPAFNTLIYNGTQTQTNTCSATYYDPEVFQDAQGVLTLFGQGVNPQWEPNKDAIYRSTRDSNTGAWTTESDALLHGLNLCSELRGPAASPSVVRMDGLGGTRYFTAFVRGNADNKRGEVFWATSSDGRVWWEVVDREGAVHSIIRPKYGDQCLPFGVGQVAVVFNPGDAFFYFILRYKHQGSPYWNVCTACQGFGEESLLFRINYDSTTMDGLGSVRQLYVNGSWIAHSGLLAWTYDPPDATAVGFETSPGLRSGAGDLKFHEATGKWLWVYFDTFLGELSSQTSSSLSSPLWSSRAAVDLSNFGRETSGYSYAGIFNGTISGTTGWWIFIPTHPNTCPEFSGLAIAAAVLDTSGL